MVIFVFVDGVGAGLPDPDVNPLARRDYLLSRFADGAGEPLPLGGRAVLADARLGVPGRPQSATGHTTILTGENAPRLLGHHLLGFPNGPLRALLQERSIFRTVLERGGRAAFANAFPVVYLRALGFEVEGEPEFELGTRRVRAAATTVAFSAAGGRFRTWQEARAGTALPHDITGDRARGHGGQLPSRDPAEAAGILLAIARAHDLTLFEFFETDEAGHARSMELAADALARVDGLLRALLPALGPEDSLVVASDHGNVEDLSTRNHTLNPVPVLGFGPAAGAIGEIVDLTGLAPLLTRLAGGGGSLRPAQPVDRVSRS
ncbi:MAG: alkaline phosphatase family protein [Anaeromyxobacteraceae bacterium]